MLVNYLTEVKLGNVKLLDKMQLLREHAICVPKNEKKRTPHIYIQSSLHSSTVY